MKITFGPDLSYFLHSFALGLILGFLYDILKAKRRIVKTNDIIINIEDIIFAVISGFMLILLAYLKNNGRLRIYSIITTGAAFITYRAVIKDRLVNLLTNIWRVVSKAFLYLIKGVMFPGRFVFERIFKPFFIKIKASLRRIVDRPHKFRMKRRS